MKAPSALPACIQIRRGVILHRPTQGWTVDEASLLYQVSIYSPTVQPWVGRWMCAMHLPWRQDESCTSDFFFSLTNRVGLHCQYRATLSLPYRRLPLGSLFTRFHCTPFDFIYRCGCRSCEIQPLLPSGVSQRSGWWGDGCKWHFRDRKQDVMGKNMRFKGKTSKKVAAGVCCSVKKSYLCTPIIIKRAQMCLRDSCG